MLPIGWVTIFPNHRNPHPPGQSLSTAATAAAKSSARARQPATLQATPGDPAISKQPIWKWKAMNGPWWYPKQDENSWKLMKTTNKNYTHILPMADLSGLFNYDGWGGLGVPRVLLPKAFVSDNPAHLQKPSTSQTSKCCWDMGLSENMVYSQWNSHLKTG